MKKDLELLELLVEKAESFEMFLIAKFILNQV